MKMIRIQILLGLLVLACARANTSLSVGTVTLIIPGGPCWDDTLTAPTPPSASNNFTLTGVTGTGYVSSDAPTVVDSSSQQDHFEYVYSLSLGGMSPAANHCIKLLIHFGRPLGCDYDVLVFANGSGTINVSSASLAPQGDINFLFDSGCLLPGNTATVFAMLSDTPPKTGTVTVIDDYTDPNSGTTTETRVNVTAIVPSVPPDWAFPLAYPLPNYFPYFQGSFVTNPAPFPSNGIFGLYSFKFQLLDGSNGLPASTAVTQTVPVVNGLFSAPLPFDPAIFMGNPLWLSMSVMPSNGSAFTPLNPPLPITPAPQAIYAYAAGVVADISPGQAVTSLDGLTDGVTLAAGPGIILDTNGNTLTVSLQPGVASDRKLKTGFMTVQPEDILARLAALPIQSWRFTNEAAGVRHVGPMAQDFKTAFGLGHDDKFIAFVDEQGVALAAIQGLNQKLAQESKDKDAEIEQLKQRLDKLEQLLARDHGGGK
jgi:hypothetical protein